MKFNNGELTKIRDAVLDSMTIEECAELTNAIVDDMKGNPELSALDSVEKIYWAVRMAYVVGYMQATIITGGAMEPEQLSREAAVIS